LINVTLTRLTIHKALKLFLPWPNKYILRQYFFGLKAKLQQLNFIITCPLMWLQFWPESLAYGMVMYEESFKKNSLLLHPQSSSAVMQMRVHKTFAALGLSMENI